jgi:hypothetical protein
MGKVPRDRRFVDVSTGGAQGVPRSEAVESSGGM